jgi:outer membrane receptor protein involved in Fe transport
MITPFPSLRDLGFRFLTAAGLLLVAPLAFGQATSTAQTPTPAEVTASGPATPIKEDTVKLNPFQVEAERDNGYYAPNTLAGTRINSKVEDLGASITVVTKQQLLDTAAVDINDIFKYESNTEGIYDYTATSSSSPTTDSIQSSPQTATRIRGIGSPNMAMNNFVMTSRIPTDTYELESVEISRGPNSTLFGLGNPSGTVELNTLRANLTRELNSLSFRVDSYGGWRSTFDFNRPLLKNKLAIRIAAVDSELKYERKPSYDNIKRLYGTISYKPFEKTTINLIWEHYKQNRQTPNYLTPRDGVTDWIAAGKPTWNPLTYTATVNGVSTQVPVATENAVPGLPGALPAGLYSNTTNYTRPSMYIDGGQVQLWEINRLGTSTNPNASTASNVRLLSGSGSGYIRSNVNQGVLYQVPGISNKGLYDWTRINAVSPNWNYDHATLYTAEVVQQLIPDLFFRAAWHLEDSNSYNRNIANPPLLQVDVNQYLLDGRSNPYYLRPFYQVIEPTIFQSPEYNDNLQAQLTYDLNAEKLTGKHWTHWLGEHRMLTYFEGRHITNGTFRYREAIIDTNHSWQAPLIANNTLSLTNGPALDRPTYRYYVGPRGSTSYNQGYTPPKSGVKGVFNLNYNQPDGSWISEPANFGTAEYITSQTRQEIVSHGAVLQSLFLDDRIVFTGGLRNDFNRTRNSNGATLNGATGLYDNAAISTWLPWTNARGKTRTLNLVVKPFPWMGLFAEKSSSFVPQAQAIDLFDTVLPNTYAHGQDVGGYINLFHDKMVIRLSLYKNQIINDRNSDSTIGSRIVRLENNATTGSDHFSLNYWAMQAATQKLGAGADIGAINALAASWENYPAFFQKTLADYTAGAALRGTNNTAARGGELSVDYNPTYNLNFKFSGAQTKSIQTSLENNITNYIALRLPYWKTVNDGLGDTWWTSTAYTTQTAENFYANAVNIPIEVSQALLGKSNPQVKEYTWRALSTYRFTEGWFKNVAVGGSIRWDSKSSIGYLAGPADPDGVVRSLDVNRSMYDPSRFAGDMHAYYTMKLYHDRVKMLIQLNWNQAFVTGGLRVTAVNPDGSPYNYRIIDPQQFILTSTFTF